ncbi:MAG TPA: DUF1778 domain-containing protein [Allocoleopsis sp.]
MKTNSETKTKLDPIDLKVSSSQKVLLEKAANLKGLTVSAYLLSHGLEAAQADLIAYNKLVLSDRDRNLFLELLENPPQPNQAMIKAMEKFQQKYAGDNL